MTVAIAARGHIHPMSATRVALATFVPSLAVYLLTLVREPDWGDPSELALQAWQFGLSHPPGSPLHNILGGLVAHLGVEPAMATNALSAVCAALAAACVAAVIHRLTSRRSAAIVGGLTFAFVHPIWSSAVVTELYAPSAALLALTLLFLISERPLAAGLAFASALGAYRPNGLMIVPAAWLAWRAGGARAMTRFLVPALLGGLAWIAWDLARVAHAPPIGTEFPPDSVSNLLRYLSAAQYTMHPSTEISFYVRRVVDHAAYVTRELLGVGVVLAAMGLQRWIGRRVFGPLVLWGALAFVYFTFHPYQDYFLMPHAGYLVVAIAIGCGVATARDVLPVHWRPAMGLAFLLPLVLLGLQYGPFRARAERREITRFVGRSFTTLPAHAVVFARWERFTTLLYFQRVHGQRADLLLLERQEKTRRYGTLVVRGWRAFAARSMRDRTVVVDGPATPELHEPADAVRLQTLGAGTLPWMRVVELREPVTPAAAPR